MLFTILGILALVIVSIISYRLIKHHNICSRHLMIFQDIIWFAIAVISFFVQSFTYFKWHI